MAEPARKLWTLDEFLTFDDGTDTRYELLDGRIFAMAPASDVHRISQDIQRASGSVNTHLTLPNGKVPLLNRSSAQRPHHPQRLMLNIDRKNPGMSFSLC